MHVSSTGAHNWATFGLTRQEEKKESETPKIAAVALMRRTLNSAGLAS